MSTPAIILYQRSETGPWWYDFHVSGTRHRRSTRTANRDAAEQVAVRAHAGVVAKAGRAARGKTGTLAGLRDADADRARAKGVGEDQARSIRDCWAHVMRVLGEDCDPADIDYDRVEAYVARRREEKARGQTIRKEIQALKRGLKAARRKGWVGELLDDWPELRNDAKDVRKAGKLHPASTIAAWLEALDQVPKAQGARAQAEFVLRTGLRAHEVYRVCWAWVEPSLPGLEVPALLRLPDSGTKDREERRVGLTVEALALLERERDGKGFNDPIFPGDHHRAYRAASTAIQSPRVITLRDLRHCHASWGAYKSGDVAAIKDALGHADLETTQLYLSSTLQRTAGTALAVGQLFEAMKDDKKRGGNGTSGSPMVGDRHSAASQMAPAAFEKGSFKRVGVTGFEPATVCSQSRCATRLRYTPRPPASYPSSAPSCNAEAILQLPSPVDHPATRRRTARATASRRWRWRGSAPRRGCQRRSMGSSGRGRGGG